MTQLAAMPAAATTPGGYLLVLAVILPVVAVLAMLACGPRHSARIALAALAAGVVVAIAIVAELVQSGVALRYVVGGWRPPLGLALRADGLSAAMLAMTALVIAAIAGFAFAQQRLDPPTRHGRAPTTFWILLMALCVLGPVSAIAETQIAAVPSPSPERAVMPRSKPTRMDPSRPCG